MPKRIGLATLILGLLFWGVFTYSSAIEVYRYYTSADRVPAGHIDWMIQPVNDESWRPLVKFKYTVDGNTYFREEPFQQGLYRTPYAAEQAVKFLKEEINLVWYSPSNPSQGTLEKFFPTKKIIYSSVLFLLVLYAAGLASYLADFWNRQNSQTKRM